MLDLVFRLVSATYCKLFNFRSNYMKTRCINMQARYVNMQVSASTCKPGISTCRPSVSTCKPGKEGYDW